MRKLLVANRGEIAIRICRAAAELGIETVAIAPDDDASCLHARRADAWQRLEGQGAAAYLDVEQIVALAVREGCDAVHPGYGFLSENATFASRCGEAGVVFVGPTPDQLSLLGDKLAARALAKECGVEILPGTTEAATPEQAKAMFDEYGGELRVVIKAVAGGGGRGMRVVDSASAVDAAFERCAKEAEAFFGSPDLYLERFVDDARHLEVQIFGDGKGGIVDLGERECSLQRQNQKVVEQAPSFGLDPFVREAVIAAARKMAEHVSYQSLGTFEFLHDRAHGQTTFMEANPRLQVEHTVTEMVTGVDLVQAQLRLASGESLEALGLATAPAPRGHAIQLRINTEKMTDKGTALPAGGTLEGFVAPTGPGVRLDSHGYAGFATSPFYDSLLAKLIVHTPGDHRAAVRKARAALRELETPGVATNAPFLEALLGDEAVEANDVSTGYIGANAARLNAAVRAQAESNASGEAAAIAGVKVDAADPLAVLKHGADDLAGARPDAAADQIEGAIPAPIQGTIVSIDVEVGTAVAAGAPVVVMEAMKMEHVIRADVAGTVREVRVRVGDAVYEGAPLLVVEPGDVDVAHAVEAEDIDLDELRGDLQEVVDAHAYGLDENRSEAAAKRHAKGHRTARENVADLIDEGSLREYGALTLAAQRRRREVEDLKQNTPGDGMVAGIASINGDRFSGHASRAVVLAYDYSVLAGTQGMYNHLKKDRMLEIAKEQRLPVVLYGEGGGGRPGDTDAPGGSGLNCLAFQYMAELSGLVPLVGITNGYCFAGNAVLLGTCDVVIATRGSNIGVGGPAMIEGGGLGVFHPSQVGPMDVQVPNGVVDIAVEDEAEATAVAKQYLAYFQGDIEPGAVPDQRLLRSVIPENRLRIYDVRKVIDTLVDEGSVLEIRRHFGHGIVTSLARIEGRSIGIVANNPHHLAGAVDRDGADKASRFMQLCDAFDIPLLFLCDTPGIMVGPEAEKEATVRHAARMFVNATSLTVPFFMIVMRKGYGLGAQAMAGGSFQNPMFSVSWPTGEFGGMGLEGAVKLGFRKELEAETDPGKRQELYEKMVARMYDVGKAVNYAPFFEIDDVIDPAESRDWILAGLDSAPPPAPRTGKKRPCIDTW
ncbi:MAG: carboxyl transferase domain-containing protein [Myxococcota bacterium]|jgi:acetyl/propionyl-CoA carboxylase alpha subunit/acetyl-CoA carboxylase carboxyltransferase component|nr:carboxyl transferase domain-containing protein [Myxococcota bacterium]